MEELQEKDTNPRNMVQKSGGLPKDKLETSEVFCGQMRQGQHHVWSKDLSYWELHPHSEAQQWHHHAVGVFISIDWRSGQS